ncbi:MAG: methyltransferase domain-containing protein [Hyphomicrobium sp.]|nr:methyltransferase domain-containing protein [Hyphomicrobium sp.]
MELDVVDLRDFYRSPLGVVVRRTLGREIRTRWPNVKGQTVVGLGYSAPYIGTFRSEARRVAALMPDSLGAIVWPSNGPVLTALVKDCQLPLADNAIDRLLVTHGLETADRPAALLREIWRVLAPEGSALLVVPNRRGVWARIDATPFGHGRPYSRSQLERLLSDGLLTPSGWSTALHQLPIGNRLVLRSAGAWERVGRQCWPAFGGIILVEARKEVMAAVGGKRVPARAVGELITTLRRDPGRSPPSIPPSTSALALPLEQEHRFLAEEILQAP